MKAIKFRNPVRHTPLAKQLERDATIKRRVRVGKLAQEKDDIADEEYVSNKLSKKILEQAREQAEEEDDLDDEEEGGEEEDGGEEMTDAPKGDKKGKGFKSFEELMAEPDTESVFSEMSETESQYNADEMTVDEEDEKALAMFMNPTQPKRLLSDIIMERMQQYEARLLRKAQAKGEPKEPEIKPEIIQVYLKVGEILKHFSAGKLPKAFKILPSLRNWERLVYVTRPDQWSGVVVRLATVLFSRGMSDKLAQRFYYAILLPKVRDEISEKKKLNFHYYLALKKSLYRPAAFFRGILLPLCESGDCSLREAVIIGSVLKRVTIPAIHASVAIYKLCQLPYYGATQHILLVLINKKFSLPYKVIDTICEYFMNFMDDERRFPALWHQTLLVFVQRYKSDLQTSQRGDLEKLMKRHHHHYYTPEIRRELFSVKPRENPKNTKVAKNPIVATNFLPSVPASMEM